MVFFQSYRLTSSCNLDVHAFPFDKQKCNLTMTASVYQDENILLKSVKTSKAASQDSHKYYISNGEWKFEELRTINRYMSYGSLNCSAVIYEITMSRRSIFYVLVVIIPMFALFLLDMAISYAFGSPGEKIAFKVTLILQVTFLSLILTDKLPATSDDPPTIAKFFTGMFVLLIFGILENAFELYLREKKSKLPSLETCANRCKKREKKVSEDAVTCLEVPKGNDQSTPFPLAESSTLVDSLAFLKHLDGELQQNKKHLALEEGQDVTEHHESMLPMEKGLYYIRLILSLMFLAFIIISWAN
ncbi:5-hydroxytryptamine receptor 3A-like [Anolis sagrei]|uniref:5-hydroxytryptamine receptor 3A-like n=1 Tax=Anolis sagrei TaxID=38937 RepID=UPI003520828F